MPDVLACNYIKRARIAIARIRHFGKQNGSDRGYFSSDSGPYSSQIDPLYRRVAKPRLQKSGKLPMTIL